MTFVEIDRLHTTALGKERIAKNACLKLDDVVVWCKNKIGSIDAQIVRRGKNFYVTVDGFIFTINAHSFTIITVHKVVKNLIL